VSLRPRGTAAESLAAFATDLCFRDIPTCVIEAAELHLLDTLGCGLAAHALGIAAEGRAAMGEGGGVPEATVIGWPERLPAPSAAFANAMLCHGLDFDDTHAGAVSHVSAVIGPVALALAEARRASGADLLAAFVAGAEAMIRLGLAASGAFHARGFHPTSVLGVLGATLAAARLGGLDAPRVASALGIAGSLAGGLLVFLEDGTPTKPVHPGWAAHGGLLAARLAAHGASGPPSVVEGRHGLFHAFVGREALDLSPALGDLGARWEVPRIAYKPYPVCHYMHGALGAAAEATCGKAFSPAEIADVVVTVPEAAVPIVLEPRPRKLAPRTPYEGKFSLQYSTAAMLVRGRVGVETYLPEAMRDPEVLEVARRVRYETRPYPTHPRAFPGGARIRLRNGQVLAADHAHQRGAPENPLPRDQVVDKFRLNAGLALAPGAVEGLETAVLGLGALADVAAVTAPLGTAGRRA
jgi:2-methylcitrate dehydratase PrpD